MIHFPFLQPALLIPTRLVPDGEFELKTSVHLNAALDWMVVAHRRSGDGGVSKGYDLLRRRWAPSYPETTGYSVPTLLNASVMLQRDDLSALALRLSDFLVHRSTREGGVGHWKTPDRPVVFDSGQMIFGMLAAYRFSNEENYLQAALHAADWIVSVQDSSGAWLEFQHLAIPKVIDTRVAWPLVELFRITGRHSYLRAATRNLDWALQQEDQDGWFQKCAFTPHEDPHTHTLAYAIEGLLQCGQRLDMPRYVEGARRAADALLGLQCPDGRLASTFARGWRPTSRSSCLTGNCQMGLIWMRLYETTCDTSYLRAAERTIRFVARTQYLNQSQAAHHGAIGGSYPITGRYERLKYPNWAAKFFADALMRLAESTSKKLETRYPG